MRRDDVFLEVLLLFREVRTPVAHDALGVRTLRVHRQVTLEIARITAPLALEVRHFVRNPFLDIEILGLSRSWQPGVLDPHVLVQQRFRRGREGADLTLETLGRHHIYVTGENARIAVRVCDVLEEVLLGVGLERASQALVLHAGDAPLQVHPLDSLPLSQRSRVFAQ